MIDVPSADVTLVLKMEPSEDISFLVLLGYKDYPNMESYVAKTRIPLEKTNEGKNVFFCLLKIGFIVNTKTFQEI